MGSIHSKYKYGLKYGILRCKENSELTQGAKYPIKLLPPKRMLHQA